MIVQKKRINIRNHSAESSLFMRRSIVIFIAIAISLTILVSNLYYLQITSFKNYQTRSNDNRISVQIVPPNRGLIYDRNGIILAENRPVYSLQVIVRNTKNLHQNLLDLQKLLSISDKELQSFKRRNNYSRSFKSIELKDQLTQKEVALFTVNQYKYQGFSIRANLKRYYPFGDSFTHVLGYIAKINNKDMQRIKARGESALYRGTRYIGKLGIEKYYEELLHGKPGRRQVEVDSWGESYSHIKLYAPGPR